MSLFARVLSSPRVSPRDGADVLVDLTPLDTSSRTSGTGRYVRELGVALDALSDAERDGLCLRGLVDLEGDHAEGALSYAGGLHQHDANGEVAWLNRRRLTLPRTLRSLAPRLFHATYSLGTPRGSLVPRVVTCLDLVRIILHRDYMPGRWAYRRFMQGVEALRFHSARRVQAISQHTADDLMRMCGVPASKIDVVLLGVDLDRYRLFSIEEERAAVAVRGRYGLTSGEYFFYMGAADPRKNVDTLIASFVKANLPGVSLAILGKMRGSDELAFTRAMRDVGDPRSVKFLGYVPEDDLPAILSGSLGFVFCSTYEGFGNVPIEAMACGCPVITTGLTSMRETVADAGLVVPARDVEATASAIRRLALEPSLRDDLRRAGLVRASRFSWKNTALASIESYRRALRTS